MKCAVFYRRSIQLGAKQRGTTMLEVLVTIIVISFGMLGLAGLQGVSLKNNSAAYYRSQATMLAYDIVERMRANKVAALNGDYKDATSASVIAGADFDDWKANVASAIPLGEVALSVGGDGTATVTIYFDGDGDGVVTKTNNKDKFITVTRL